jgi:hypothetical protein
MVGGAIRLLNMLYRGLRQFILAMFGVVLADS